MRQIILIVGTVPFLFSFATAQDSIVAKPHLSGRFPQVIQAFDYQTIKFIESLYEALPHSKSPEIGFGDSANLETNGRTIKFLSIGSRTSPVSLEMRGRDSVALGNLVYQDSNTCILGNALLSLISDLVDSSNRVGVKFAQFGTRGYKRRTIIEFRSRSRVVTLESYSNGSKDPERLYILDLVHAKDSFFWFDASSKSWFWDSKNE